MTEVAIIEDTQADLDRLTVCFHQFEKKQGSASANGTNNTVDTVNAAAGKTHAGKINDTNSSESFHLTHYPDAERFLKEYTPRFDVVFMDIELPGRNGMEAAKKLRAMDTQVCLVFVTNLASYAVDGYKVNALDYVMKPVRYGPFEILMKNVLQYVEHTHVDGLAIQLPEGIARLSIASIQYIEVIRHNLTFHQEDGSTVTIRGTMKDMETALLPRHFSRINNGYLVNLRHVRGVIGNDAIVGKDRLPIGRTKKKAFMDELTAYLGI